MALNLQSTLEGPTFFEEDVVEKIFCFLPVKDTARYGVLASRFRNLWRESRNLVFDSSLARGKSREQFNTIVRNILNRHLANKIDNFHLYVNQPKVESELPHWLEIVALKEVDYIYIDFIPKKCSPKFEFLSEIESLKSLKLRNCNFVVTSSKQNWCLLKDIVLHRVEIREAFGTRLVPSCPVLANLELSQCSMKNRMHFDAKDLKYFKSFSMRDCAGFSKITIDAPTLVKLCYWGFPTNIHMSSATPNLSNIWINFDKPDGIYFGQFGVGSFVMSLSNSTNLFKINNSFLEVVLREMEGLRGINWQYSVDNLNELQLTIENSHVNPHDIVSFIEKFCTKLEKFDIDFGTYSFRGGQSMDIHHPNAMSRSQSALPNLKELVWTNFKFENIALDMLKLFLGKATNLEIVTIVSFRRGGSGFSSEDTEEYAQLFYNTWKASPSANIRFL